ncbi:MAG: hypothetical protein ULS35scaffold63_55 [Phage 33_17]|nr:MAG: hypothetical protein ULS35scaffold63_55 [Phage 33_17]
MKLIYKGQKYMPWTCFGRALDQFNLTQKEFGDMLTISEQAITGHKRRGRFPLGYYGLFRSKMVESWVEELNKKIKVLDQIFEGE